MQKLALDEEILLQVEQPARYIGGEINSVKKDPDKVKLRFAMCFPDVYEIGMSHIGIQILYDMLNRREDTFCERLFSPWVDLDKILREKNIPLFSLESQENVKDADILGITLLIILNLDKFVLTARKEFSGIQIFLKNEVDKTQMDSFENKLRENQQLRDVVFVSKEETMESFKSNIGYETDIFSDLEITG